MRNSLSKANPTSRSTHRLQIGLDGTLKSQTRAGKSPK